MADAIVAAAERGAFLSTMASAGGVSRSTVRSWLTAGRRLAAADADGVELTAHDVGCLDLARRVDAALSACELALIDRVREAAADDWRAATWLLAHRFPRAAQVDHGTDDRHRASDAELTADGPADGVMSPAVARALAVVRGITAPAEMPAAVADVLTRFTPGAEAEPDV